jgi:hypothetical protein
VSIVGQDPTPGVCVRHPRRQTALRCGKCGDFICTKCAVQTPVGARCRSCAQLKRLPQFDVGLVLTARSTIAGFVVSVVMWLFTGYVAYLRFFLSILVGAAVGEVMSRLARRRTSRTLEALAVASVVAGLAISDLFRWRDNPHLLWTGLRDDPSFALTLLLPAAIASYVAVIKLR